MRFATRAIHEGQSADPTTGATIVPIYQTSTFTQLEIGKHRGYDYSRSGNPTRTALETALASLEGGRWGMSFASGLAAITATLSILGTGDHVVATQDLYGGTFRLFEKVLRPQGVSFTYVDGSNPAAFAGAINEHTRLIWVETPTNPMLTLVDLAAVADICRSHHVRLAVDNTFATPYLQRPLELGADVVVHSTTKYLNGHSDVVGGAVITSDQQLFDAISFYQNAAGAIPGPFDTWLTLRGLKTLAVRMRQHQDNAARVAAFLAGHPRVKSVTFPGLDSYPQRELARRQMSGSGAMVSFEIHGGRPQANSFFKALKVISFAESLGGVESLICHPATMTHASMPEAERQKRGITEGLIRLSVGIEDADDLIEDLDQALAAAR